MRSDIPSISSIYKPGAGITTVSPDKELFHHKIEIKKISENLIKVKEIIQILEKPSKKAKEDSIINKKNIIKNNSTI